jgi:hypothetical protein
MSGSWQNFLVAGAAVVFMAFLLWRYRPTLPGSMPRARWRGFRGRGGPIEATIKDALARAASAATPRERALALVEAAEAAARAPDGLTSAMGFYLRAMRADATFCDPVRGMAALLAAERPELLETVLWRRLSHLDWSGDGIPAVKCTALALAELYRRDLRHRVRARALEKMVSRL